MNAKAQLAPAPSRPTDEEITKKGQRYDVAKHALQGLLASSPTATQTTTNAEQYASRAVRYADALIEALNRTTEEAIHARRPR